VSAGPLVIDGVLYGMDAHVATWVNAQLGSGTVMIPMQAIAIVGSDIPTGPIPDNVSEKIIAGVIFYGVNKGITGVDQDTGERFTWNKIQCSVACTNIEACRPEMIARLIDYAYSDADCDLITCEISLSNTRAIRQAEKLGFRKVGIMESMRPGGEMAFMTMRKDQCEIWQKYKPEPEQKAA
jgi:hypothetical protein